MLRRDFEVFFLGTAIYRTRMEEARPKAPAYLAKKPLGGKQLTMRQAAPLLGFRLRFRGAGGALQEHRERAVGPGRPSTLTGALAPTLADRLGGRRIGRP